MKQQHTFIFLPPKTPLKEKVSLLLQKELGKNLQLTRDNNIFWEKKLLKGNKDEAD